MIKYRAWAHNLEIKAVDVLKETDKCVFFADSIYTKGRRENKMSDFYCYFDTWQEAKDYMEMKVGNEIITIELNLKRLKDKLHKIQAMASKMEEDKHD
jgi:hypothetical protein